MRYGIALDIGTSGFRCQALDLDTKETVATAITARHPIPGMNVIDHVNFAIRSGADVGNRLILATVNNLFGMLGVDLDKVETVAVCGNPFQLSLFQNIEIRDLAYAGKSMLRDLGVVSPDRSGNVLEAMELGLFSVPNAKVIIPPAVTHEIGADAIAMLLVTGVLDKNETAIVVDYGTNAEMALVKDGEVFTGSAAAGPALEGQQIERGMLASTGALSDVDPDGEGWVCHVLDPTLAPRAGDTVDPRTGDIIGKGEMHGKARGITGTGVVAALSCGIDDGVVGTMGIDTPDGMIHLQDGIKISRRDVDEAGKAIGALRTGFLTLMLEAGVWVDDVKTAYMSGASGLYVDANKAKSIGMVTPGAERIIQFGNTSIVLARRLVLGETTLEELRTFAEKLLAKHCMFATSEDFKNIYSVELSYWCYGMPMSEYNNMLDISGIPPIPLEPSKAEVERMVIRDLPDIDEDRGVTIMEAPGVLLTGQIDGCTYCGICRDRCPETALMLSEEGDGIVAHVRSDLCAGTACRRCENDCPEKVFSFDSLRIGS
ncbi:MAG: methylamine methyltransferase corrinoid protein reductive activase [Candidatus Methanomethylophilaceae archaeon]|jgi:methylamine methyltransferase corrinoid protein reductive activase|nr:methylamine methyltransferase corrinoid protein reductive activase [Candidatus Methanomethylophilaceae archaeon]NLF33717.1 methylamine methyltransferase corrinoid protein reductive activase [Thermoplasmatales archaeon]